MKRNRTVLLVLGMLAFPPAVIIVEIALKAHVNRSEASLESKVSAISSLSKPNAVPLVHPDPQPATDGSGPPVAMGESAPVLMQSAPGASPTGSSSARVSFRVPSASGDAIVLFVRFGGATILTVTDNQVRRSNTYTSVLGPTQWGLPPNATDRSAQVFVANNITGGTTLTITVALSGKSTHDTYMAALEYSGVGHTNPVNATAVGTGTNSHGEPTTANVVTTIPNVKLVATTWDSNESYTPTGNGAGYTTAVAAGIVSISGGSGWANLTEDRTASTAGTWKATASSSPAVNDWIVQMVALAPQSQLASK
jgi:hypothetical protein